jgi:hypothetical protein
MKEITRTQLEQMYRSEGSLLKTANSLGCCVETVRRMLKAANIATNKHGVRSSKSTGKRMYKIITDDQSVSLTSSVESTV